LTPPLKGTTFHFEPSFKGNVVPLKIELFIQITPFALKYINVFKKIVIENATKPQLKHPVETNCGNSE